MGYMILIPTGDKINFRRESLICYHLSYTMMILFKDKIKSNTSPFKKKIAVGDLVKAGICLMHFCVSGAWETNVC